MLSKIFPKRQKSINHYHCNTISKHAKKVLEVHQSGLQQEVMSVVTFCFHSGNVQLCELLQVNNRSLIKTYLQYIHHLWLSFVCFFGQQQYESELSFSSTHSDPPLSPISLISQEERDDVYPTIHVETSQVGSRPTEPTAEIPLLMSDPGTILVDSQPEHVNYKPQIATLAPQGGEVKETEEEQRDLPSFWEEDRCVRFGVLLGGFLSGVEVGFTDPPLGLTLSSDSGLLWPKTPKTTIALNGGFSLERRATENDVEADSLSLDLQQGEIMTPDTADTCSSQYTVQTTLKSGYFPQAAAVSSTALCDAQR